MKIKKYLSIMPFYSLNYYQTIHSIKTAFACLLGVFIERYYELPSGQWIPIITMVVMGTQLNFEGALQKSYMRFLGTVCGITISLIVLEFFGNNIIIIFCALFISFVFFAYVASSASNISYAGIVGGITIIFTLAGENADTEIAIQRGTYTVVGISIALLVSRFVFPIHSRHNFRPNVARTLRSLQKFYTKAIKTCTQNNQHDQKIIGIELDANIAKNILAQFSIVNETSSEDSIFAKNKSILTEVICSEHNLYRIINLIYADNEIKISAINPKHFLPIEKLSSVIENTLRYLASCFENVTLPDDKSMTDLNSAILDIKYLIEKTLKHNEMHKTIIEYSSLFFIEKFLKELKNINQLIIEVNSKNKNSMV